MSVMSCCTAIYTSYVYIYMHKAYANMHRYERQGFYGLLGDSNTAYT